MHCTVGLPVELLEVPVALELADDAVAVEGHEHLAADLLPPADLLVGETDPGPQGVAAAGREELQHLLRDLADPGRHHVRVGVVAQASLGGARVPLVELVRAHDAVDLPPIAVRVEVGDGPPEARDLQHHLGPAVAQEVEVVRRLVEVPYVVEDRRADVPLVAAEIRVPAPRERVEVDDLGFLPPVAAALPGVHRPLVAACAGRRAGLADPPEAVQDQRPRYQGQPEVEEGIDEELVPEDVPAVCLAVEAASRDAGVVVGGEPRADLEEMRGMEAQQELDALLPRKLRVADLPELVPRPGLAGEGAVEGRIAGGALGRGLQRLADAAVVRAVERRDLLDPYGRALVHVERQHLLYVVLALVGAASDLDLLAAAIDARARGLGDFNPRLTGSRLQRDHVGAVDPGSLRIEVTALELPVAGDALVHDPPVERRHDLDGPRPVLRRQVPGECGLVHAVHAHEAAAPQSGLPARSIPKAQLAHDQRVAEVVLVPVGEELDVAEPTGLLSLDAELEHEPIRKVDQILVGHRMNAHDGRPSVVDAVRVGARVVRLVRVLPLRAAPRAEVAVARRGQGFPQPFFGGIETVVDEQEVVHRSLAGRHVQLIRGSGERASTISAGRRESGSSWGSGQTPGVRPCTAGSP